MEMMLHLPHEGALLISQNYDAEYEFCLVDRAITEGEDNSPVAE